MALKIEETIIVKINWNVKFCTLNISFSVSVDRQRMYFEIVFYLYKDIHIWSEKFGYVDFVFNI